MCDTSEKKENNVRQLQPSITATSNDLSLDLREELTGADHKLAFVQQAITRDSVDLSSDGRAGLDLIFDDIRGSMQKARDGA